MVATDRREIGALLKCDPAEMRVSERLEFDHLSRGRPIVLMGAGGLGRRTLAGLRQHGIEPLAFADNGKHGTILDGLAILRPETAAKEFGRRAVFVVTIWGANRPHRFAHSERQLRGLGCDVVCPFPPLFWKYPETLLPFYLQDLPSRLLEQRNDVSLGFELWEDHASRAEYLAQVRLRLSADFDGLSHPIQHPQYFPDDLLDWSDHEWIVDGGAYDGDTVRTISRLFGDRFEHILAVEPDPTNYSHLQRTVASLSSDVRVKIDCRRMALGSESRMLHLDATGTAASATCLVPSPGTIEVDAKPLDALIEKKGPTLIKLDIEGFEADALLGARETIVRHGPILAVCAYHRQDHLWRLPLMLREWRDDYAFFLRPHNEEGWDLVCYAVPRARLKANR